jgi:hypothetical protein
MPPRRGAQKENAQANAAQPTVLTLEVTAGPCKGVVFADQVSPHAPRAGLKAQRGGEVAHAVTGETEDCTARGGVR